MAVPVASAAALEHLERVADKMVTMAVGSMAKFYVADFYRYWHDLSDNEVLRCLKEWRMRRFRANIEPPLK